jgi:hypothetical protein
MKDTNSLGPTTWNCEYQITVKSVNKCLINLKSIWLFYKISDKIISRAIILNIIL